MLQMMSWLFLLVCWGVTAACGAALTFRFLRNHFRHQLEAAEAKWHLQHQQDSPGTVIENVSVGWINLLLQSLWAPVLEKHVAGLTAELLGKVFGEVLAKGSQKAPWKYLDGISVESMSFGLVPPTFQVAQTKYDPTSSMLTIATDVRFTSSSAQAVLLVRTKTVGVFAPVTVRLEVTHVKLRGRLRLGLLLGREAPGIQGVYYSFTAPPHLDVAVGPLGLPLPAIIPGVDNALRGVISKLVSRRLVEPQRRYVDVHRIYMNKHIARVGGPGGLLKVVILCANNLSDVTKQQQTPEGVVGSPDSADPVGASAGQSKPSSKAAGSSSSNSSSNAKLSSYCEVRFGQTMLRTPFVHHSSTTDASWNWEFSLALPFELDSRPPAAAAAAGGSSGSSGGAGVSQPSSAGGIDASDALSLAIFDSQTVGQPVQLGKAKVSLRTLQLQPNGPARSLVLPLHKAQNSRASVQLTLQWLKSTKPVQKRQPRNTFGQRAVVQQDAGVLPAQQVEPAVEADERLSASSRTLPAANKNVSWHDKTQLRVRSAASAAKKSLRQLKSSSSDSSLDKLPAPADEGLAVSKPGGSALASGVGQQHQDFGPWGGTMAAASDPASSSSAGSACGTQQQQNGPPVSLPQQQQQAHSAQGAANTPLTALARPQRPPPTSASGGSFSSARPAAQGPAGHTNSQLQPPGSIGWLAGWGSWLWPDSSAQSLAASGAVGRTASAPSAAGSPWSQSTKGRSGTAVDGDDDDDAAAWWGPHSQDSFASAGSTSPLMLLSRVVHMQKEMEQQRVQLEETQRQLQRSTNSYQRLKQVCRQRGRAALLRGGRFLLHKADGSTQHVLLYLTQVAWSSSRGGQQVGLGSPDYVGDTLIIAALPETRKEARMAFKRLAAGAGDKPWAPAAAGSGTLAGGALRAGSGVLRAGSGVEACRSGVSASGPSFVSSGGGAGPRVSAFGSMGAGLRLRLQRGTTLQMGYESGKLPKGALQGLRAIPGNQLVGVVRGNAHFAAPPTNAGMPLLLRSYSMGGGGGAAAAVAAAECFTLMVEEHGSLHVTAINLQLPLVGNGRSLDEWLLALRDVVEAGGAAAGSELRSTAHVAAVQTGGDRSVIVAQIANNGPQQTLEGRDWLLSAAAKPMPWPQGGQSATAAEPDDSSDTGDSSDSDDN